VLTLRFSVARSGIAVGYDQVWETIFQSGGWGRYPSESVVRFVARHFFSVPDRQEVKILDLGCGCGANAWFLAREGFRVTAIDGSVSGVAQTEALLQRERCSADVRVCDFLNLSFPDDEFDAVVDCASIQHNPWEDIVSIHNKVHRMLKPGGWFFGMMLSGDSSRPSETQALRGGDARGFRAGSIDQGVFVHFFARHEFDQLLGGYDPVSIDTVDRTDRGGASRVAQFVVEAQKPATSGRTQCQV
jgi:SAM-dependent methyltransferase